MTSAGQAVFSGSVTGSLLFQLSMLSLASRTAQRTATVRLNTLASTIRMSSTKSSPATYKFNHTMLRIKDPKASIPFYENVLGMKKFRESSGSDFTNYFLAYPSEFGSKDMSEEEMGKVMFDKQGVLELCWNHGTESDPEFKGYVSGNEEPHRGFGHIAITVDNLEAAVARFDEMGVKFKKRPEDGRMRHIAFIYDPDGYWIEILAQNREVEHK